ncbi:MAG: glycosyltransferase family 4 protein [Vicinamibacteria bacterium]|nr:glycosyltransferase family 4 protein [Vicinamibacteria bacterium]
MTTYLQPDSNAHAPVRVMRLFSRLNIGGPSLHVIYLAAHLDARGYETRLVVGQEEPHEGNFQDLARECGVTCLQVKALGRAIRPRADLRALFELYRLMRRERPVIVHTHTAKAGVLGRIAARLSGVPIVVHTYHGHVLHGYFGRLQNAFFRTLERFLARGSDRLIAVSDSVRADLLALGIGRPEQMSVISLGLDLERYTHPAPRGELRRQLGVALTTPLVGIVGRLVPIKDLDCFLEAARIVRETGCAAHFVIVGDGEERARLERFAQELKIAAQVSFLGWRRDLTAVYADLDLVVNTSRNEGTPVALIEALAAGRPVIATEVGGTPDLLARGAHGRLIPPRSPSALAAAVIESLKAPEILLERTRRGRRFVLEHYSVARLVADIDTLYRELLSTRTKV